MREIRLYGSEGGEAKVFPTPIIPMKKSPKASLKFQKTKDIKGDRNEDPV